MNNSNSREITINLDRPNLCYFTGETVSGTVELNVIEEKIEASEVYIQLTGEIGYTTQETVPAGANIDTARTVYHHVPFYSTKAVFSQPKAGQKELMFGPRQYSWPFQILLTNDLPPTLNLPSSVHHVQYYLQVVIDEPNKSERKHLTIYPCVNLLQNPQYLQPTMFGNHNRKHITLKGTINKLGYVPGEVIHITLEINNPRKVLIRRIDFSMLRLYQIEKNEGQDNIFHKTLPNIMNLKDQQIQETFSMAIPSVPMPPSYQYRGLKHPRMHHYRNLRYMLKHGVPLYQYQGPEHPDVNTRYMLKLAVKVEGIFTSFDIDIPITIGTEPNPEQSMFPDHNFPPNYDSVRQNTK